jgi:hypothetical protein
MASGPVGEVVSTYRAAERSLVDVGRFNTRGRLGTGWALVKDLRLIDEAGLTVTGRPAEDDLVFELDLELNEASKSGASLGV